MRNGRGAALCRVAAPALFTCEASPRHRDHECGPDFIGGLDPIHCAALTRMEGRSHLQLKTARRAFLVWSGGTCPPCFALTFPLRPKPIDVSVQVLPGGRTLLDVKPVTDGKDTG
ncbi:hypothetical protein GGQ68_003364 [Sagittula marina]|uniref:Uncharacterized protein n=1 Tax=Sagittula marina TaxID=943940 RepID=A0A7W6GTF5_9RHOB|nr:hypothetical protein [Sagittula marina]MBB3987020.1 hypothetical protein [Sagittula marina]